MPEGARGGKGAEAADGLRGAARVRPEPAVHGHAHVAVHALPGEIAGDEADHAGGEETHPVDGALVGHHLVEGGHGPRRGVAAASRGARPAEVRVVLLGARDLAPAVGGRLVHVHRARVLRVG